MKLNIFKHNRIQTSQLLRDTIDFLVDKFNQSKKVFSVSSAYGQILFVLEQLSNLIFYYIEDSVTELSIREATRDTSVYSISDAAGYRPARSIASSGQILLRQKPTIDEDIVGNVVIIPNYLKIKCINNEVSYILELTQDDIRVDLTNNNPIYVNILQGYIDSQILSSGTGSPYASYSLNFPKNYHIDNNFVQVYVNDVPQPLYENLLKIPSGGAGCMVRTGIASGLDIFFGNGKYGNYPDLGAEIRVEYLVTDGFNGNIKTDNIDDILWEFSDSAFDASGNEVNLNEVFDISTIISPDFGSNSEPIALTRLMLSKSTDRLMVESDYELLLKRMQSFSIVRVGRDMKNDRIFNMFLIPDVTKLISGKLDYFSIPLDKFILSELRKNELLRYIEKIGVKTISTDVRIIDPIISKYILNISLIVFKNYDQNVIKMDIISKISDYFLTISRHDRIPRSDLIRIIEDVDGVDSVNVRIVSENNEKSKILNPENPDISIDDMNDIIINNNELAVIRGGWSDRYGNYYDTTYRNDQALGAVNIVIKKLS